MVNLDIYIHTHVCVSFSLPFSYAPVISLICSDSSKRSTTMDGGIGRREIPSHQPVVRRQPANGHIQNHYEDMRERNRYLRQKLQVCSKCQKWHYALGNIGNTSVGGYCYTYSACYPNLYMYMYHALRMEQT